VLHRHYADVSSREIGQEVRQLETRGGGGGRTESLRYLFLRRSKKRLKVTIVANEKNKGCCVCKLCSQLSTF